MSRPNYCNTTVQKNGTKSNFTSLVGQKLLGIITPPGLVSTTLSFNMTPNKNGNPMLTLPVNGTSSPISLNVAPSGFYGFTRDQQCMFEGVEDVQVVAGSTETSAAIFQLVLIPRPSI